MELDIQNEAVMHTERRDVKRRGPIVTQLFVDNLADSALIKDRPFTQEDVRTARRTMLIIAPFAHPRVFPNYWEHIVYSSILARHIAEGVGFEGLTPYEAETLQFIGDDGSIVIPHRYYRKNIVNELMDKKIGIRRALVTKQPPIPEILGRRKKVQTIEDMTLPQIILDLADNLGKLNPDGTSFSLSQMKRYDESQARRYTGVFPSERFGLGALADKGKQKFAIDLIFAEIDILRSKFGLDIEEFCREAFKEFSLPDNQSYLRNLKQAQETLDPKVDEILGRPAVKFVVFDVGGVLTNLADEQLWQAMSVQLNRTPQQILKAVSNSLDQGMPGKISKEAYLSRFIAALDLPFPSSIEEAERYFDCPQAYYPIPGMPEVVAKMIKNPNLEVFVLSDAIAPLVKPNMDKIREYYPGIKEANVLFSSVIGAAKREQGSPAFRILLERLNNPNPQTILFIDDNVNYTTNARARFNIRAMHFRENDPERLKVELEKAHLI